MVDNAIQNIISNFNLKPNYFLGIFFKMLFNFRPIKGTEKVGMSCCSLYVWRGRRQRQQGLKYIKW